MKKFRELDAATQELILDKHDIGPLFFAQRAALKELFMKSDYHYFEFVNVLNTYVMHIHIPETA